MYTILLADDEESVIEVLRSSIGWQELGVGTLLSVMDGMAALEEFEKHRIDLLNCRYSYASDGRHGTDSQSKENLSLDPLYSFDSIWGI